MIANLYYAQPLTGLITASLGMPADAAGLLVTLPLAGYGAGLLLIVPLADLVENRRLTLILVAFEALCMLLLGMIGQPVVFLGVALIVGATAAAVQVLVPYATYFGPEASRGKAVARVVSGVMLGIMLARPVSSLVTELSSWRAVFGLSAALMAALFAALWTALPPRQPPAALTYRALLLSMGGLFAGTEALRRRVLYHACMFGAFSVFWTAIPLWLSSPAFGLTQEGIAWVALAGVAGATAPPVAAWAVDRGFCQWGTALAMLVAALSFPLSALASGHSRLGLGLVVASAILLDFAVSANLVFGQRVIFALGSAERSRLNGLYLATFFMGGAIGSASSGWLYARYGWPGACVLGAALPVLGAVYFATEHFGRSRPALPQPNGSSP